MDTTEGLQKNILDATLRVFDQKGLKFTMDDLAKELSISKKTIYTVYDDKEALFLAMVDYIFDSIKESEQMILTDPSDRKSTRLNSSHSRKSRMPSSA